MSQIQLVELMQHAMPGHSEKLPKDPSKYTPADIRMGIQAFAAQGNMVMAHALTDAGLTLHPNSEDLLAMAGLMALTSEDWGDAIVLLEQLLQVQGANAPAMTYRMLVRALRCNLEPARAQRVLIQGFKAWPNDADLLGEKDDFFDGPAVMPAPSSSN
ncbi:MAG: hypothetical protein RL520_205 [Pseudomonadota bacterium]|jgi:hypothetical protein